MTRVGVRSVERLVNMQILRYKELQRVDERRAAGASSSETAAGRHMVTVSREHGAGGEELGRRLSERLGFGFFSQELVHEIAKLAHVRRQLVETLDERCRDGVEAWVSDLMEGGGFQPSDYLRNLTRVIATLGRHGQGVIIGRAGHLLLDSSRTLRVRVVAPLEYRVLRVANREATTRDAARAQIEHIDAQRRDFYRTHFATDITDPGQFDLVINTGSVDVIEAAELVLTTFQRRFGAQAAPNSGVRWASPHGWASGMRVSGSR